MKADPQPEAKPPSSAPTIVEVTAIDFQNIHGLNVRWQVSGIINKMNIKKKKKKHTIRLLILESHIEAGLTNFIFIHNPSLHCRFTMYL